MKNTIKLLGILIIVTLNVLIITACDEESGKFPTVTITGNPKVGEKIIAASSGKAQFQGDFIWESAEPGYGFSSGNLYSNNSTIGGINKNELIIGADLVGKRIRATRNTSEGIVFGNEIGPIEN